MDKRDENSFQINPPAELDAAVFAKITPVLAENKKINSTKRWFQVWIPAASTAALTAFSFWYLNKKVKDPKLPNEAQDMDLQAFASIELDEESIELANNLELLEELDLIEAYAEDEENS